MVESVSLREVENSDLPFFFAHQRDPEANRMAAFTSPEPENRKAFDIHWTSIRANERGIIRTILVDGRVAGNIVCYEEPEGFDVGYWIDRAYWGRGVATQALRLFLQIVPTRPLFARVAFDNIGSQRVLQKCGFIEYGKEMSYANARGTDIEEILLRLDA